MTDTRKLKAIKVVHDYQGEETTTYIDYDTFERSFVKERWQGERRYARKYTLWGYNHTYMTVKSPMGNVSSRYFTFPNSVEQAIEIDKEVQG